MKNFENFPQRKLPLETVNETAKIEADFRPESYFDSDAFAMENFNLLPDFLGTSSEVLKKQFKLIETSLKTNVEERPLRTLGSALAAGYVAGLLIRRIGGPEGSPRRATD